VVAALWRLEIVNGLTMAARHGRIDTTSFGTLRSAILRWWKSRRIRRKTFLKSIREILGD
jgi:hypothetical protein